MYNISNSKTNKIMSKTKSIIAITGNNVKVEIISGLTPRQAAYQRRELATSEENFDMLGKTCAIYRTKTCK